MKNRKYFQISILISWLIFTFIGFMYFTFERLSEFDPNGVLKNISRNQFTQSFLDEKIAMSGSNTIIHFYQTDCACNNSSETHIQQLNDVATKNNYSFVSLEVDNALLVPSTPSVAIINETNELVYYGPYGEGLGCSQTNGFALTVMNNHLLGYSANLIVQSAKGCYCNNNVS